jgi:hypothetical protein
MPKDTEIDDVGADAVAVIACALENWSSESGS